MENSANNAAQYSSGTSMGAVSRAVFAHACGTMLFLASAMVFAGCGDSPAPKPAEPVAEKPAEPAVPADIQAAADGTLGSEAKVLVYGDLAKNGKQQVLVANVVPKTPKENITGTIVTRAVIAENDGGKWEEKLRCDEHLKNEKGYLGMTPIEPVSGWRLQFEQDEQKGLTLYMTPVKGTDDKHVLPIGIRWNPKTKRYQSLDRTYEQFLLESPALSTTRSQLK